MWPIIKVSTAAVLDRGLQGGIVPKCDSTGTDPDLRDCTIDVLAETGANALNALIAITIVVVVFVLIYGAIRLITSAGSPENRKTAKTIMTNSVVGLVVVLAAWVIINTFFTVFVDCQGSWWIFQGLQCGT